MLGALNTGRRRRGFTLIELGLVLAVAAALIVIAAPSLADFVRLQRLKGVNAQLVTDLEYARSQSFARRQYVAVRFGTNTALTCYTLYAPATHGITCNCSNGPGAACPAGLDELKTVVLDRADKVTVGPYSPPPGAGPMFAYEYIVGGLMSVPLDYDWTPLGSYSIQASLDDNRVLRTTVGGAGKISVCAPASTSVGAPACP
jgi:type IV fimbrial biogenesis protein FimT